MNRAATTGRVGRAVWVSTSRSTPGGMTTFVESMAHTQLWREWQVRFVETHRPGTVGRRMRAFCAGLLAFLRELAHRPDVVHLHTAKGGSFFRKAVLLEVARAARVPVVLHVHGGEFRVFYDRMPRPLRRVIRATLCHADVVAALGDGWTRRLQELAPSARVVSVPNGIPIGDVSPRAGDGESVHVVFLGRIGDAKGTFTLLKAWQRVVRERVGGVPVRLTVAGDGEVDRARGVVTELGIGDSVEIRSWLRAPQVEEMLRTAHVLTLPSRNEGQPMSILEAMAHGLTVVASDVGGIPDLVEDGSTGLLVPADDVSALSSALQKVIDDPALRVRLGDAAYAQARESFDIEMVGRRFEQIYRELTAPSARIGS